MSLALFFQAVLIGVCIAAPVGPCGLLCISRSMRGGFRAGLATGLGVTLADTVYAAVGAFGVSAMIAFLEKLSGPLRVAGGIFLIVLGWRLAFQKPKPDSILPGEDRLHSAWISAFLVTLANPLTILSFIAIFAGLGVTTGGGFFPALLVVIGVGTGSLIWWLLLSWLSAHFGQRLRSEWLDRITPLAGWLIAALGMVSLLSTYGHALKK